MNRAIVFRHLFLATLAGAVYFCLFVGESIAMRYHGVPLVLHTLLYLGATVSVLSVFALNRFVWALSWTIICLVSSFAGYYIDNYGVDINRDSMIVLFQATAREINSFASIEMLYVLLLGLLLAIAGIVLFALFPRPKLSARHMLLVLFPALCILCAVPRIASSYAPYNIAIALFDYARYMADYYQKMGKRYDIANKPAHFVNTGDKPLTIVLVLGESARADHFSLNGYKRDTNPLLKQVPNLVNFPHTTSCGTMTFVSVPCLLGRATRTNKAPITTETTVISVFRKLGFDTSWFGSQGTFSPDDPISTIHKEAKHSLMLMGLEGDDPMDEELYPYLDEVLDKNENAFVVLHTNGSHFFYTDRYTKPFERYLPVCQSLDRNAPDRIFAWTNTSEARIKKFKLKSQKFIRTCPGLPLTNSYDNSILHTDWFLNGVIERLKDKNALFIYVSDHGESLGENRKYIHGHRAEFSNWHVPMMWWASDAFIANDPARWENIKSHQNLDVSHDNIFHSLLDCAGVVSPLIQKELSFCQPAPAN